MNSVGPTGSNDTLLSGSSENYRWQIVSPDTNSGTFTLVLRQGNDSSVQQSILETWGPLSLDPFASNYIEKVIGNQVETIQQDNGEYYLQMSGSYPNQSSYIRVKQVNQTTPNYFDNVGNPKSQYTGSIPVTQSGVFGDGKGNIIPTGTPGAYYENISNTNIQGLTANAYTESISLLANKDAYNYNLLVAPGLIADPTNFPLHNSVVNQMITLAQQRGDFMVVTDVVGYGSNINPVVTSAQTKDTSAGINRGIMTSVVKTERVLTQGNRDLLYKNNVNPIANVATANGSAITVFGQKTLQKRTTALDRVNVRRLLIELKNYISQVADTFVFEQNNEITRNNFLSLVNPYLSLVQQQQGLTSFRVIMDETNNPPSVVDQNQLIGQIYLQPTRTAEFIILDFNILPTGATFPS